MMTLATLLINGDCINGYGNEEGMRINIIT